MNSITISASKKFQYLSSKQLKHLHTINVIESSPRKHSFNFKLVSKFYFEITNPKILPKEKAFLKRISRVRSLKLSLGGSLISVFPLLRYFKSATTIKIQIKGLDVVDFKLNYAKRLSSLTSFGIQIRSQNIQAITSSHLKEKNSIEENLIHQLSKVATLKALYIDLNDLKSLMTDLYILKPLLSNENIQEFDLRFYSFVDVMALIKKPANKIAIFEKVEFLAISYDYKTIWNAKEAFYDRKAIHKKYKKKLMLLIRKSGSISQKFIEAFPNMQVFDYVLPEKVTEIAENKGLPPEILQMPKLNTLIVESPSNETLSTFAEYPKKIILESFWFHGAGIPMDTMLSQMECITSVAENLKELKLSLEKSVHLIKFYEIHQQIEKIKTLKSFRLDCWPYNEVAKPLQVILPESITSYSLKVVRQGIYMFLESIESVTLEELKIESPVETLNFNSLMAIIQKLPSLRSLELKFPVSSLYYEDFQKFKRGLKEANSKLKKLSISFEKITPLNRSRNFNFQLLNDCSDFESIELIPSPYLKPFEYFNKQ